MADFKFIYNFLNKKFFERRFKTKCIFGLHYAKLTCNMTFLLMLFNVAKKKMNSFKSVNANISFYNYNEN